MTSYPYASNTKIQASMDAIGAAFIGSQEVTILKQILVGVTNGGITPPFDPIVITAPDGAYAGATLLITGGAYAIYSEGEYILAVDDELPAVQVYQFVINGTPGGEWVTSPANIPDTVETGDFVQVRDISGFWSNSIIIDQIAYSPPTVAPVLTGSQTAALQVNLNWSASNKEATVDFVYDIEGRLNGGSWSVLGTEAAGVLTKNLTLSGAGFWDFRVTPKNSAGNGPSSNVLNIWLDPLFGLNFPMRLQAHRGDNSTIGLLYQDTACTIPATTDGHAVQGVRHVTTGAVLATQATTASAPILRVTGGVPWLDWGDLRIKFMTFSTPLNETFRNIAAAQIWNGGVATSVSTSTVFFASNGTGGTRINLRTAANGGTCSALVSRLDSGDALVSPTVSVAGTTWRVFSLQLAYSLGTARTGINNTWGSDVTFNSGAGNSNDTSSTLITVGRNTGGPAGGFSSFLVAQSVLGGTDQTKIQTYLTSLNP